MIDVTVELTPLGMSEAEKISDASRDPKYAILSLIYESDSHRLGASEIQSATDMSEEKCRKMLRQLAKQGFIRSAR